MKKDIIIKKNSSQHIYLYSSSNLCFLIIQRERERVKVNKYAETRCQCSDIKN